MANLTRREWNKLTFGGFATAAFALNCAGETKKIDLRFNGVQMGVQTYSFRDRSLEEAIKTMTEIKLGSCELWQEHTEPRDLLNRQAKDTNARAALRDWRLRVPLDEFKQVRAKFNRAGIDLYAYNLSIRDDFTDAEIARGFEMAKALGAKVLTSSSNVNTVKRIDPIARHFKMRVGLHNHSDVKNPNEISTPDSFARVLAGASEYIAINLDIGHFTAANFNAVEFLREHHERIVTLHIKDRKRAQGANVPFGQGDTPIRETLMLLRQNQWHIPANIEYEYDGRDTTQEVARCLSYCKEILLTK